MRRGGEGALCKLFFTQNRELNVNIRIAITDGDPNQGVFVNNEGYL